MRTISCQETLSRLSPQGGFFSSLLAALCAQLRPLHPRRVYRHERDGGDHSFSRYSESGEAANRTEIVSPANEQYENRSKMLRYHNKQEPLRKLRKQRSGIQAEYKRNTSGQCSSRFCSLLPIRSASSGVLFVGCWYYLQKPERFTPPTAHRLAASRFARLWAFGRRAQAIHHQAIYRYDTVAVEKSRQNRTSRRPCQISATEKKLTNLYYHTEIIAIFFITIKSAPSGRIAHSVF